MIYSDLIRFEPIETSVCLGKSGDLEQAAQLVRSFVLSDDIAGRLNAIIFPHLRIDAPCDNKGLLIIGGRGTGKSHLMAFVAAIAEYPELAGQIPDREVADAASTVAGRFKIIRANVSATGRSLHDQVCAHIQAGLASWGIDCVLSNRRRRADFQRCFAGMMLEFHKHFPDQGLLLVMDELLDYLRGRGRRGLRRDLDFLRQLGAACGHYNFRLMAGLQERLSGRVDSLLPAAFVRRVLDCFVQVPMPRNNLRFVVQHRLARKTPEQEAKIREHLGRFMHFYGNMEDRLEEFVAMFPVHPDYLDVVGRVSCVDKTDLLRGLSSAVQRILHTPLPADHPGLIAYDSYWEDLRVNASLCALPEVQAVVAVSRRVESALTKSDMPAQRQPLARRLIHALSVHRLTTGGIYTPRGSPPNDLRDQLCLPGVRIPNSLGKPVDDALAQVIALFSDLHEIVQGKLLSINPHNFECRLRLNRFKRFVKHELLLHWVNAVPFLLLMATGAAMLISRFSHFEQALFNLLVTVHKCSAIFWLIFLPLTVLARPGVHWPHLRSMLTWGKEDLVWVVQTLRSLHNKYAPMSPADRFNTGQKINACLVMLYFFGFGATGLTMLWKSTILLPWYIHAGLFFLTLGSVSGHLFLALVNPSTRIALFGIFHGWAPLEYVLHHHALSAPECLREHLPEHPHALSLWREISTARRELAVLAAAAAIILAVVIYDRLRLESIKQVFAKSFAEAVQPSALSTKHRLGKTAEACTQCHSYTGEIPDYKCEQCHAEIRNRRVAQIGYHGKVQGDCRTCHKEHPASTNSVVPFTAARFDHDLASFKLQGRHTRLACDECHKRKRKPNSPGTYYIGLSHDSCRACHEDRHKGQFTASCETCHSPLGWTGDKLKFAHNTDSAFKLSGKHTALDCAKCHKPENSRARLATAAFKGVSHECASCHRDPHRKQFAQPCTSCHSTAGWGREYLAFDHNTQATYPLVGKHAQAACEQCHRPGKPGDRLGFASFRDLKTECADCHREPHAGQFARACQSCHPAPTAWTGNELRFVHNTDSQFLLLGKHSSTDCAKCHKPPQPNSKLGYARFKGLPTGCEDCHRVQHPSSYGSSCRACHTLDGWPKQKPGSDHILKHEIGGESLGGKHLLAKCGECHSPNRIGSLQQVRRVRYLCKDCHQKDQSHADDPQTDCAKCHGVSGWKQDDLQFDHDAVIRFTLNRDHRNVPCFRCHENAKWKPVDPTCESCHKNLKRK